MKIKKLEIKGLHGNSEPLILNFNSDLNILSGRNGAGKTTILKLMWYLISGNFDKAVAEIKFDAVELETDIYNLLIKIDFNNKNNPFKSDLKLKKNNVLKNFEADEELARLIKTKKTEDITWYLTQYIESSFFMPTFRMIEGGFTTEKYDIKHDIIKEFYLDINKDNNYTDTEFALKKISSNLSKQKHKFFTSISAKDIDTFLVKKYAEIMKKVNFLQSESLNLYTKKLSLMAKKDLIKPENQEVFKSLNKKIELLETEINTLNKPLDKIKSAITDFMPSFDIEFDEKIYFIPKNNIVDDSFEDPLLQYSFDTDVEPNFDFDDFDFDDFDFDINEDRENSLTINNLSAGEKQLLTFVAYNIFHNDTIFFIDEPELSLHIDWQSKLFSLLKEQNSTNQFIISTHSPFIYSLFPDKELIIDSDKGCSEFY